MLKDKVALITGAASGIGYAIAKKMTEEGCKVVIADVNKIIGEAIRDVMQ